MNSAVSTIPLSQLAIALLPALVALGIFYQWSDNASRAAWSVLRMLIQLLLVGYALTFVFTYDSAMLVILILMVMILASTWIALGSVKSKIKDFFLIVLISIVAGGLSTLFLITQGVLQLDPWLSSKTVLPLAGMIFSSSMNAISLAVERLYAELPRCSYKEARSAAFNAALIPNVNSMFAVGLVSLPGMMTGQILSGVSPLIAARYQIVVMSMLFGASAISVACFLALAGLKRASR